MNGDDSERVVREIVSKVLEDTTESSQEMDSSSQPLFPHHHNQPDVGDVDYVISQRNSSKMPFAKRYQQITATPSSLYTNATTSSSQLIQSHIDSADNLKSVSNGYNNLSASSSNHSMFSTLSSPSTSNSVLGDKLTDWMNQGESGSVLYDNLINLDFLNDDNYQENTATPNDAIDLKDKLPDLPMPDFQNGKFSDFLEPTDFNMECLRMAAEEVGKLHPNQTSSDSEPVFNTGNYGADDNLYNMKSLTLPFLDMRDKIQQSPNHAFNISNNNYLPPTLTQRPQIDFNQQNLFNTPKPMNIPCDLRFLSFPPPALPRLPQETTRPFLFPPSVQRYPNPLNNMNLGFNPLTVRPPLPQLIPNGNYVKNDTPSYSLLQRDQFAGQNIQNQRLALQKMPPDVLKELGIKLKVPPNNHDSTKRDWSIHPLTLNTSSHSERKIDPYTEAVKALEKYLNVCYGQWSLLETERKKTEAELAMAFPGRTAPSVNIPIPKQTNPSKLDKIVVDMWREYSKILTLMVKMQQIRASSSKKFEDLVLEIEQDMITFTSSFSEESAQSQPDFEPGPRPGPIVPYTLLKRGEAINNPEDNEPNLDNTHPEIRRDILAWRAAIKEIIFIKDKENKFFMNGNDPSPGSSKAAENPKLDENVDIYNQQLINKTTVLNIKLKHLAKCARLARTALWCDLILTKALAGTPKPKPEKEPKFEFAALEILRKRQATQESINSDESTQETSLPTSDSTSDSKKTTEDPSCNVKDKTTSSTNASNNEKNSSNNNKTQSSSNSNRNKSSSSRNNSNMLNHHRLSPKRANPLMFPYGGAAFYYPPRTGMQYFPYDRSRFVQPFNINYRYTGQPHRMASNGVRGKDYKQPNHNNNYLSAAPIK